MNQRIAKKFRRAIVAREDLPVEERQPMYRQMKQDYIQYGFLNSQNPKPLKTKRQRQLTKMIQNLKEQSA